MLLACLTVLLPALPPPAMAEEPPADPVPPAANDIEAVLGGLAINDIRGVNYIHTTVDDPAVCPVIQFGQDSNCPWNIEAIAADLDRMQALGVNAIRVFLDFYTFGGARLTNPDYRMTEALSHLDALLHEAHIRGIYVLPVLLAKYPQDRFGVEHHETALVYHLLPLVAHLDKHPNIVGWDLFNEPDIGSPVNIRCWDWSNADEPACFPMANERLYFLRAMREGLRLIDSERPLTISLAFAKNYFSPLGTVVYVADLVEFYSFHYYDNEPYDSGRYAEHWYYGEGFPADLDRALAELVALGLDKPIVVSELGFPAGPGHLRTTEELRRDLDIAYDLVHFQYGSGIMLWPFQVEPEALVSNLYQRTR